MNNTEIINELVNVTGESRETCEIVVKGFEKVSEEVLAGKFHGKKFSMDEKISMVSEFTQVDEAVCRTIVAELDTTLENALSDKLRFFRRNK